MPSGWCSPREPIARRIVARQCLRRHATLCTRGARWRAARFGPQTLLLAGERPGLGKRLEGGAGVGKSRAASALAYRYGVPLAEADDIVTALKAMTSYAQQPRLHYWTTHPQVLSWAPEKIVDLHLEVV